MNDSLVSPDVALDLGYKEGSELRQRQGARSGQLEADIVTNGVLYRGSPYYEYWLLGFRSGHAGERKPALP